MSILIIMIILSSASASRAAEFTPAWKQELSLAARAGDEQNALVHVHRALRLANSDSREAFVEILRELASIYQDLGLDDRARMVGDLLLTPAANPTDSPLLREHKLAVRRLAILDAADRIAGADYVLADILYSTLLPSPTIVERIFNQDATADEFEIKVVDRLVRLYLAHDDVDRARSLVEKMTLEVKALASSNPDRNAGKLKLAMLDCDMALVLEAEKKLKSADRLLARSAVTVERYLGPDNPQLATIYADLGSISARRERWPEAVSRYRHALKIVERAFHVRTATKKAILESYSRALARAHRSKEAEKRALEARMLIPD
ncbi:MAG: tetratricopeptide repeat protein [Cyanobacteria bacterium HKST-UBA02]|nr:tetratricopeptide repeat protein [Cyanobacteria bacterium HKST-UBA02]